MCRRLRRSMVRESRNPRARLVMPLPPLLRGDGTLRRLRSTGALRRVGGALNIDGSLRKLRSSGQLLLQFGPVAGEAEEHVVEVGGVHGEALDRDGLRPKVVEQSVYRGETAVCRHVERERV